jgi:hypothetical protein
MPKTITLTKPNILQILIDLTPGSERVRVMYALTDDAGVSYQTGELILWRTMPTIPPNPDGSPGTVPENWIQLPAGAKTALTDLVAYIKTRLTALLSDTPTPS